jgi:hypothetical protein
VGGGGGGGGGVGNVTVLLHERFMIEHSKGVPVSRPMIILKAKVLYAKTWHLWWR